ncbi:TSC22 domain family protein 2 [Biomphalaria pfeifferi]|uniref:TSC22 domain family protein 2 n=1 Tax=Biomphalaria pfeifferi TaxID=112525 RepID=A0AAD8FDD5_BIOPF|nr:TSC22 domain family protein 2 [Biomphalaria pfeifferi]
MLSALTSMRSTSSSSGDLLAQEMEMMSFPRVMSIGAPEFTMPFDAFFFSGFQCLESIAGGSTVAIDNKIEQAMDLVKRHLMYAVREEVEILKQQIGEMMERIGQLEHENSVLKAEAKPETLNKLLQPRAPTAAPLTAPVSVMSTQSQQQTNTMQSAAPQSQTQVQIQTPASAPAVVAQQQSAQQAQLPQSQASQPSLQAPHPPT